MKESRHKPYLYQTAGTYYGLENLLEFNLYHFNYVSSALQDLEKRRAVAEYVEDLGFRRLTYFDSGTHALVLDTVDDQLVRIVHKSERRRDSIPHVLHPIYATSNEEEQMLGFRIEVLPKLYVEGTREHAYSLTEALAKLGYNFRSNTPENVRLLPDGTPIIVDADAIQTENEFREMWEQGEWKRGYTWESYQSFKNHPDPPYYWGELDYPASWTQKKLIPQIGTGEITGVISGSRLRTLETKLGHEDSLVATIRDRGLYPAQLPEAMKYRMDVVEGRVLN